MKLCDLSHRKRIPDLTRCWNRLLTHSFVWRHWKLLLQKSKYYLGKVALPALYSLHLSFLIRVVSLYLSEISRMGLEQVNVDRGELGENERSARSDSSRSHGWLIGRFSVPRSMSSQDTGEKRNGAKTKQEMLKTALFAACLLAATHMHINCQEGALLELWERVWKPNEARRKCLPLSGGAVWVQLKLRRKNIFKRTVTGIGKGRQKLLSLCRKSNRCGEGEPVFQAPGQQERKPSGLSSCRMTPQDSSAICFQSQPAWY